MYDRCGNGFEASVLQGASLPERNCRTAAHTYLSVHEDLVHAQDQGQEEVRACQDQLQKDQEVSEVADEGRQSRWH